MKDGYFFDALNEISDEHIAEAVAYEPKAKIIQWKKLVPIAACLIAIAVSVFAVTQSEKPVITTYVTTEDYTYSLPMTTVSCAPVRDWESMNYGERFNYITVKDVRYVFCDETLSDDTIGNSLVSEKVSVEYMKDDFRTATAEIYEIKDISSDIFTAFRFTEDEKGEYFLYYNTDYTPSTLGHYIDDINAVNNISFVDKTITYRNDYPNGDFKQVTYRIDEKVEKELFEMLTRLKDTACEPKDYHETTETVKIYTEVMNQTHMIYLTGGGELYTYFGADDDMFCFNIGTDEFRKFVAFLEGEAETIRTLMGCPASELVTTPTTVPDYSVLPSALESNKTLGEIADIPGFHLKSTSWVVYEQDGEEDTVYSTGYAFNELFLKLIELNSDKNAIVRTSETGERLQFEPMYYQDEEDIYVYLCNDGYLYITYGTITRAFEIGTDAYNEFMDKFYGVSCVWTPEHPVTIG